MPLLRDVVVDDREEEKKGKIGQAILSADGNVLSMRFWWTREDVCSYFAVVCHVLHKSIGILSFFWDGGRVREACQGILQVCRLTLLHDTNNRITNMNRTWSVCV